MSNVRISLTDEQLIELAAQVDDALLHVVEEMDRYNAWQLPVDECVARIKVLEAIQSKLRRHLLDANGKPYVVMP